MKFNTNELVREQTNREQNESNKTHDGTEGGGRSEGRPRLSLKTIQVHGGNYRSIIILFII